MGFRQAMFHVKSHTVMRSSHRMFAELQRTARLSSEDLLVLQARRAIDLARFAMANTHFYRDFYTAAGFRLGDLDDPAAFSELPIVEKAHLRENFDAFVSNERTPRNSVVALTGGSTGEPTRLLRDLRTPTRAIEWRLFSWWGIDPSADIAFVVRPFRSGLARVAHGIVWWPSARFELDAYQLDDAHIDPFLERWRRVRPELLVGYVGGTSEFARIVAARHPGLPAPRAIGVTAAPLTTAIRRDISAALGAPVFDHYRSAEIPWIAGECREQNGLHTFADVRKVEIVNEAGATCAPEAVGQVVATDLTNRVFPIVRYRLGDRTSIMPGQCRCGVPFPRIAQVAGRVSDVLRMPDGQAIAAEGFTYVFSIEPQAIRQFHIHQHEDFKITVTVIVGHASDARAGIDRAIDRFREIVGNKVPVTLQLAESIPHDGGKIRYIRSDVPAPA